MLLVTHALVHASISAYYEIDVRWRRRRVLLILTAAAAAVADDEARPLLCSWLWLTINTVFLFFFVVFS